MVAVPGSPDNMVDEIQVPSPKQSPAPTLQQMDGVNHNQHPSLTSQSQIGSAFGNDAGIQDSAIQSGNQMGSSMQSVQSMATSIPQHVHSTVMSELPVRDEDEGPWCYCITSDGEFFARCSNISCRVKWFHPACLGLCSSLCNENGELPPENTPQFAQASQEMAEIMDTIEADTDFLCPECWVKLGQPLSEWPRNPTLRKWFRAEVASNVAAQPNADPGDPWRQAH